MSNIEQNDLPVMMYLHGFMSGANGAMQRQLQRHFKGRYRVIAPELDADPDRSLAIIADVIDEEKPQVIVGTSLGAWMAMMSKCLGADYILVNPVTAPLEELVRWLDVPQEYFCKRLDGVQTYTLTREVLDKYSIYDLREANAYRGGNFHLLCSTKDELLGDRHIRTLKPYFSPKSMTIVDDFGHQCCDAGLKHLIEIIERVVARRSVPYQPGMLAIISESDRMAAMARSRLLDEILSEK